MHRRKFLKSLAASAAVMGVGNLPAFASLPKMKITRVRAYAAAQSQSALQPERHGGDGGN